MPDLPAPQIIALAGGCFWCVQAVFEQVRGVLDAESGYSNGQAARPTYEEVCTGHTGCAEVVRLAYDPARIGTRQLLEIFFTVHDPTQLNRQGADVGTQYRSGIYTTTPEQRSAAWQLIGELEAAHAFNAPIATEVAPLTHYWPAEDYHQDFFEKHPTQGYCVAVAAPKVAKFRHTFVRFVKV
ncbi:MAG: peptide-methionine (S)-S-oxide reductase MsrA [Burkholderiaceae bacterium]|jgi:peptide-methionine (S)-S-oxide reductase|nr:peptide-methionine (S)-S-oxide reductase MsrA [Burkholderiaceae bacterium]